MSITHTDQMSEQAYREYALTDRAKLVELVLGQLREKPAMSAAHGDVMMHCAVLLSNQLHRGAFKVRVQHARLRVSSATYYIPDVAVIPTALERPLLEPPSSLDAYSQPLPLVIEVWSPSTGDYDIDTKLPGYQQRGDLEIWYIHPYERTLTASRRQPNGAYVESVYRGGEVRSAFLPDVSISLEALFEM